MKRTTIQFDAEVEKVNAIRLYLDDKENGIEKELSEYVETLYKKYVPAQVREFIEKSDKHDEKTIKKREPKISTNKADSGDCVDNRVNSLK